MVKGGRERASGQEKCFGFFFFCMSETEQTIMKEGFKCGTYGGQEGPHLKSS